MNIIFGFLNNLYMTNHEHLLTTWTSLKSKLSKFIFLNKHQQLIKDALETHLNQSSSFTSPNSYSPAMLSYWTGEKEGVNRELEREDLDEARTTELKAQLDHANQMLERANLERQAFEW